METGDRDAPVSVMQARHQRRERAQGIRRAAAVTAGVQVPARALERDFEGEEAPARDDDRGQIRPPHGSVGREHEVGRELLGERCGGRLEVAAAALLLALDQEFEVDREPPSNREERLRHKDRDQHRPLVV